MFGSMVGFSGLADRVKTAAIFFACCEENRKRSILANSKNGFSTQKIH